SGRESDNALHDVFTKGGRGEEGPWLIPNPDGPSVRDGQASSIARVDAELFAAVANMGQTPRRKVALAVQTALALVRQQMEGAFITPKPFARRQPGGVGQSVFVVAFCQQPATEDDAPALGVERIGFGILPEAIQVGMLLLHRKGDAALFPEAFEVRKLCSQA